MREETIIPRYSVTLVQPVLAREYVPFLLLRTRSHSCNQSPCLTGRACRRSDPSCSLVLITIMWKLCTMQCT